MYQLLSNIQFKLPVYTAMARHIAFQTFHYIYSYFIDALRIWLLFPQTQKSFTAVAIYYKWKQEWTLNTHKKRNKKVRKLNVMDGRSTKTTTAISGKFCLCYERHSNILSSSIFRTYILYICDKVTSLGNWRADNKSAPQRKVELMFDANENDTNT